MEKALEANIITSDSILSAKVLDFAFRVMKINLKDHMDGLDNFKRRYNLEQYDMYGEAASAPLKDLNAMCENLHQILKNYDPKDIFNCDETGLFWKIRPNSTISNGPVTRTKQSKDRVTVLLTCNATGSEKLPLLFIHKSQNPRALKNINKSSLPVNYY